jgi:hypothetical protein
MCIAISSSHATARFNTTSETPKQRFDIIRFVYIYIQLLTLEMFLFSEPILILFSIFNLCFFNNYPACKILHIFS